MKVIFLDVDGVLNSQQLFEKCEDDQLISVDEDNIKNLKTIVDATGAKIVLSSSWRYGWAEHSDAVQDWCQILVDILAKYDLKIIDKTEYLSSGRREDEIKDWLDKCEEKIEGFVILDDGAYEWHRHGFDKHLVAKKNTTVVQENTKRLKDRQLHSRCWKTYNMTKQKQTESAI